jgi:hypothetical protein
MPKTIRDRSEKPQDSTIPEFHCVIQLMDGTTTGSPVKGREGLIRFLQYAPDGEFKSIQIRRVK